MDYFYFSASRRKRGSSPGPLNNSPALKVQCLRVPNALLDNHFLYYFEKRSKHSHNCTARQCSPVRRKFMECYNQSSSIGFDETSSYLSALKAPDFSAFHWSPRGNLVSIGQHLVITRVVHLPTRTETSLITESVRFGN